MFTIFPWLNEIQSCFKQTSFKSYSYKGLRISVGVEWGLTISSDNPLDFNDKIWLLALLTLLKYLCVGWNTK